MATAMVQRSGASLPKQMDDMASLKAAYRLLDSEGVTHDSVSQSHWNLTREKVRVPGLGKVLFVQDGTELDYSGHRNTEGLGFSGNSKNYGIQVQTTLCVLPGQDDLHTEVVGLALQSPWIRDHEPRRKTECNFERTHRRTEHDVWEESLEAIGAPPPADSGTLWVSVGDRGSDIFSYMAYALESGWNVLVRSSHDRKLTKEDEPFHLHALMRSLPFQAQTSISLRARPGVKAREALLNVSWTSVSLNPTPTSRRKQRIDLNCVRVWEEGGGIEWLLLTSLPVTSEEEALEIVRFYRKRWLIEEYHKCLKTGCKVEERQVATKDRLFALLGVLSIVAVYLLQFKAPSKSARSPAQIAKIVKALTKAKENLEEPRALFRRIAMLGGFQGRKGDGEPGWQSIWAGWTRLLDIMIGFELAQSLICG
jgi:hypothetical protein